MRIRDLILPEDKVFFTLFREMSEKIAEASTTLNEITHELPGGTEKSHKVRQIEHQGDEITRKIFEQLDESLITPLEPEEIARLAPVLDDVLDRIDWVTHQLCNYEIPGTNDVLKEYSYLILLASAEIGEAVEGLSTLKNLDDVKSHSLEVSRLYNLSTELLSRAILDLFKTQDLLMIIKLKDIYESMARVMVKCNDVGHTLNDIAMAPRMIGMEPIIIFGVLLALALNFVNGLNDASHSIATVVATKALSPFKAVLSTAICNMVGPFLFTTAVAATIGTAIVSKDGLTPLSIVVAMGAAIILVFVATRAGIPISSSHAMVGGLLGAGIAVAGLSAVILPTFTALEEVIVFGLLGAVAGAVVLGLFTASFREDARFGAMLGGVCGAALIIPAMMLLGIIKISGLLAIVLFIFISPIIGMTGAFLFDILISHAFRHSRQNRMKRIFQPLHVLACLVQATAHGANDGQHAVGVITALLISSGILMTFDVPLWVILTSAIAIGLGTCFGGWQVVDKMAKDITKIRPYQGFCAATASSAILVSVTEMGIPVSSTHAINGAIIGVGATRGKNAVQWKVVREMMTAWIITIPLAVVVAWAGYFIVAFALTAI